MKSSDTPNADASVDKIRRSAEREATSGAAPAAADQSREVDAYHELSDTEHSKGRPDHHKDGKSPSNAGNDGN